MVNLYPLLHVPVSEYVKRILLRSIGCRSRSTALMDTVPVMLRVAMGCCRRPRTVCCPSFTRGIVLCCIPLLCTGRTILTRRAMGSLRKLVVMRFLVRRMNRRCNRLIIGVRSNLMRLSMTLVVLLCRVCTRLMVKIIVVRCRLTWRCRCSGACCLRSTRVSTKWCLVVRWTILSV